MRSALCCALLAAGIVLGGCKTKKQAPSTVTETIPAAKADSILSQALAEETLELPYRESNPRSNDLLHTKLEVSFDWTNARLNGRATLKVKPYFYPVTILYLDARGMEIKSLEVFEVATVMEKQPSKKGKEEQPQETEVWHKVTNSSWAHENDSLKITLGRVFYEHEHYYVVIGYIARPNELKNPGGSAAITEDKGLYFVNPTGENVFKMPQIWTQGETQASSVWFPTIDSPNERMTQEIFMNVEDRFTTLSNGALVASEKQSNGTRTDHWKLDQPHAPYLAMMAVGEFKKVTDEPWKDREISYYVEKDYEAHAKAIFGDTREMIEVYSTKLGVPYPWPKYAQIAVRDYVSGAMENTSATLHGDFMVYQTTRETIDAKRGEAVIAHELFHQWFGDLVTCESWSNLPLNESFAVYGEYLWYEHKHGRDAADHHHWQSRQGYLHSNKEVNIIRYRYNVRDDMFDGFSYNKGGQVLHMLRKAVGDEAFFASLKNYLETNRYKPVEIHNLRLAFEEVTGRDMNWFFNQWFLDKGRPDLKVSSTYNAAANVVELSVEQKQNLKRTPLYRLPLEVDIYVNGKAERRHIEVTEKSQTFSLSVSGKPDLVNFDAERQLLCNLDYKKPKEEYIFQYRNAPLFEDRLEALTALESRIAEPDVFSLFKEAATGDKFHEIRIHALGKLEKAGPDKMADLKTILTGVYHSDQKTTVRARALSLLNRRFLNDPDVQELNEKALGEQSYAICAEALEGMAKKDPAKAMARAKRFEKEGGKDVLFAVGTIYSNHGSDDEIPFFHNAIRFITGFDMLTFTSLYVRTAKRCSTSTSAIATGMDLEALGKGANKYMKFAVQRGLKDLISAWEGRENSLRTAIEAAKKEGKSAGTLEAELKTASETKASLSQMLSRVK